jgi:capsular exopolysaccharide synthesis family protein
MSSQKVIKNQSIIDAKDVKNALNLVIKNWFWFILFVGMGVAGAVFIYYKTTRIYGAEAKVLITPTKNAFKDALSTSLPVGPNKEEVANEIQILSSTRLVSEAIRKLNLDIAYYIKGRLKTGEVYKGTPFSVDGKILDESFYGIPFNFRIIDKDSYNLSIQTESYSFNKTLKFGEPVVTEKFSIIINGKSEAILKNPKFSEFQYIFVINNHNYLVKKYKNSLSLDKDKDASVINVSIEDEVEEKAVDFLDTLTKLYINYSISVAREINENSLQFIEDQLKEVENQLNGVESNLVEYQQQSGAIDVSNQQSAFLKEKIDVQGEKAKLMVRLNSVEYVYNQLTSGNADFNTISPTLFADQNNPGLATAFSDLSALMQRKTNLSFSLTPNSPQMKELEAQINRAKENVIGIVMNIRKDIVMQINLLSQREGSFAASLNRMPSTIKGLSDITRKKEINEKMYLFLLETRAQTVIAKAAIVPDKSILEPASSSGLLRPIRNKILFMGIGVGLALSFLVIFLKSIFLNYVFTKEDLADITHQPIIGVIGKSAEAKKEYLVVHSHPQSLAAEAFRVIRTNLSYFAPKSSSKVILFTSTISGEGKTFCAVNTATILARAKKKVVIVDLDLHKPKQATAWNMTNDVGVTSYIVGKATLKDTLKDTPVENLKVILSGPKSPNASELILDNMMDQLIQELKQHFDYVILDMPPVGLLSDALVMMKQSDLNLYVMKAGYSKKDFVEVAHQLMEKNNIKSLSFILNGVNPKNMPVGYGGAYYK